MSKSRKLTSTFFCNKKNCLADMLVNFFLLDKVTLEEHGTTKKLSITFLLRSGQLICFDPSSKSRLHPPFTFRREWMWTKLFWRPWFHWRSTCRLHFQSLPRCRGLCWPTCARWTRCRVSPNNRRISHFWYTSIWNGAGATRSGRQFDPWSSLT